MRAVTYPSLSPLRVPVILEHELGWIELESICTGEVVRWRVGARRRGSEHPVERQQPADLIHCVAIYRPVDAIPYVWPDRDGRTSSGDSECPRKVMAKDLGDEVADGKCHLVGDATSSGLMVHPIQLAADHLRRDSHRSCQI